MGVAPIPLEIQTGEKQGIPILDLSGAIIFGEECSYLRKQIRELLDADQKRILLNLRDVTCVDSSGIGVLVELVVLTAKEGGQLKLLNVPRFLYDFLAVHRLRQALNVFDNEEEALASFERADAAFGYSE